MIVAVIVAGGQGLRMGGRLLKQFLPLGGKPLLCHTLQVFDACPQVDRMVVVLPQTQIECFRNTVLPQVVIYKPIIPVAGGDSRQESVYNGLQAIDGELGIVLIHDGVRPLVPMTLIQACIAQVRPDQGCIPGVAVVDTLKQIDGQGFVCGTVSRLGLWMIQTPQAFSLSLIKSAHRQARQHGWQATDDAALVERVGGRVVVIPGAAENIKVTTPDDLILAEFFLRLRLENPK